MSDHHSTESVATPKNPAYHKEAGVWGDLSVDGIGAGRRVLSRHCDFQPFTQCAHGLVQGVNLGGMSDVYHLVHILRGGM